MQANLVIYKYQQGWRRHNSPLKLWGTFTTLHGVTASKTVCWIFELNLNWNSLLKN